MCGCHGLQDRIGKNMIEAAEAKGLIKPGVTRLVEPTSGNTGMCVCIRMVRVCACMRVCKHANAHRIVCIVAAYVHLTELRRWLRQ